MDANQDIVQGKWPELKDQVQHKWSKPTDEDIARLSGRAEELASALRLRYRYGRIEADMEIRNWLRVSRKKKGPHQGLSIGRLYASMQLNSLMTQMALHRAGPFCIVSSQMAAISHWPLGCSPNTDNSVRFMLTTESAWC